MFWTKQGKHKRFLNLISLNLKAVTWANETNSGGTTNRTQILNKKLSWKFKKGIIKRNILQASQRKHSVRLHQYSVVTGLLTLQHFLQNSNSKSFACMKYCEDVNVFTVYFFYTNKMLVQAFHSTNMFASDHTAQIKKLQPQ